MKMQSLNRHLDIEDVHEATTLDADGAVIGELSALLSPERSLVEDDIHFARFGHRRNGLAVLQQRYDGSLRGILVVSEEAGLARFAENLMVDVSINVASLLGLSIGTSAILLLLHEIAEALLIHLDALFLCHFQGEVDREAVGVMKGEGIIARQYAGLGAVYGKIKDLGTRGEGAAECLFLGTGNLQNLIETLVQLGIGLLHRVLRGGHQGGDDDVVNTKETHGTDGAAQQSTQHVTAAIVAGADAVADKHH